MCVCLYNLCQEVSVVASAMTVEKLPFLYSVKGKGLSLVIIHARESYATNVGRSDCLLNRQSTYLVKGHIIPTPLRSDASVSVC